MNYRTLEKRHSADRRNRPTPLLSRFAITGGRRKSVRRKHDKRKHIFLDKYDTRLLIAILTLLIMSVIDGFLTLLLVSENIIIEANPFMAFWLGYGYMPFYWVKYALTAVSLFIFCVLKHFPFTNIALAFSIAIYASVVLYQCWLIYKYYPSSL